MSTPRDIPAPSHVSPLRVPNWPLPPYRYVPGLHPHPFRHPQGHLYTDGSAPAEPAWSPGPWRRDRQYLRGLDLLERRYLWEAHEVWEAVWHQVPRGDSYGQLLQGLIQASAGVLKRHMGHHASSQRLLAVAADRLIAVRAQRGEGFKGLELSALIEQLQANPAPEWLSVSDQGRPAEAARAKVCE